MFTNITVCNFLIFYFTKQKNHTRTVGPQFLEVHINLILINQLCQSNQWFYLFIVGMLFYRNLTHEK